MKKLVIFGAGQQGRLCKKLAKENGYKVIAFVDDYFKGEELEGIPVFTFLSEIPNFKKYYYFVAVGDIGARIKFIDLIGSHSLRTCNLVDKTSHIEKGAKVGKGNFIYKDTIIYEGAEIGDYNIINTQTMLAIDSKVGNNNNFGMGCKVCGGVKIGNNNYFGAQTVFVSGSKLGDDITLSPCSVVRT